MDSTCALTISCLIHVRSTNMEEVGFMTSITVSHQGAIETLWLHIVCKLASEVPPLLISLPWVL